MCYMVWHCRSDLWKLMDPVSWQALQFASMFTHNSIRTSTTSNVGNGCMYKHVTYRNMGLYLHIMLHSVASLHFC